MDRPVTIQVRMTEAEKASFERAALAADLSVSAWVRRQLRFAASCQEREVSPPPPLLPDKAPKPNGSAASRGTRLSEDWRLPDEWRDFAVKVYHVKPMQAVRESLKFRDYFLSVSGEKGVKRNWLATWRLWCDRTQKHGGWDA